MSECSETCAPHLFQYCSPECERQARRIDALRRGATQWGHAGRHRGNGAPDCPRHLHHHHDYRCEYPTLLECVEAGVEWRRPSEWGSRA